MVLSPWAVDDASTLMDAGPFRDDACMYRVTRMVAEKIMLTSNSKFRHRPGWQANLTAKRNFKF